MTEKPKKERRFLKAMGRVGEILIQEVLIKIGSNLIKKIGGKKTLPSILFLLASLSLFAQYPNTGNKQRLGFQTTGDGLVFRGRTNDTMALKPSTINNAYFILDTVNNVLFNYIKTKGGWVFNNTDTVINNITVDTTSLSNRINLKLNISDTASMLAPYFKDLDTTSLNLTSRFGAKLNISDTASMLTNYLRTGIAASTYLPLTGGTLSGALSGTTGTFNTRLGVGIYVASPTLFTSGSGDQEIHFTHSDNVPGRKVSLRLTNNNSGFYTYGGLIYALQGEGLNQYNRMTLGINTTEVLHLTRFSRVGIMNNSPSYTLDVNGTFNATGNSLIGGTLGVSGATNISNTLNATTGTFTGLNVNNTTTEGIITLQGYDNNTATRIQFKTTGNIRRQILLPTSDSNLEFRTSTIGGTQGGYSFYTRRNPNPSEFLAFNIDVDGNSNFYGTLGVTGATTLSAPLAVNSSAVFNEGSTDSDFRVESDGNVNMVFVDASTDRVGIGTNAPSKTLEVNGTFNSTGDITEGGNNVLTNLDTASLSSRIDLKLNKTDTASLSNRINGKVSLTGDEYINGQKTFGGLIIPSNGMQLTATGNNSNKLIGINASSFVGEVTLGTGLTLTSNVLNASTTDTTSLSNRINLKYDKTGGTISGAVTLSTTTATPTSLLGKDGSNVVGTVTTVAQTGLMTRGETTATTGSPSAIFTVTHGLGATPTSVLVTSAGLAGAEKIIFEVYTKNSTTFSVQAWNYDGTEASSKSVKIFWLAIK